MMHDVLRFRSNALLLLYEYDLRELTYQTRFTMPSINISRKFSSLPACVLFSLIPDNLFMGIQTLKRVFCCLGFFLICPAKLVPPSILTFWFLGFSVPCLKAILAVAWINDVLFFLKKASDWV